MLRIEKTLPGELEGEIDPEDYGFDVIPEPPIDEEEAATRVGHLYAQVKKRTGIVIEPLEPYLAAVSKGASNRNTPGGPQSEDCT